MRRIGAALAKTGNRTEDNRRVDPGQFLVAQPQALHHAGAKAFDHGVAIAYQVKESGFISRILEVQGN
ncbi:hypothetical protein D3C76_1754600 [compost metagenome]